MNDNGKKNTEPRENIAEASTGASTFPGVVDEENGAPAKTIGEDEIKAAAKILEAYRAGKTALDERLIDNNQWYKMRHWAKIRRKKAGADKDPEPASAWLFSTLNNKHADAMDNIPELNVLPREFADVDEAKRLSAIMPVIFEQCKYGQVYSDMWWSKLKGGTGVIGVFWNPSKNNGLGDIDIRPIDILNLFWEPGIKDIQDSASFFSVQLVNNDALEALYPELRGQLGGDDNQVKVYRCDRAEICDIGDGAPLNPCDACGDAPYLSLTDELCTMRVDPPVYCEDKDADCETCECLFDCVERQTVQYVQKQRAKAEQTEKKKRSRRKRKRESAGTASA